MPTSRLNLLRLTVTLPLVWCLNPAFLWGAQETVDLHANKFQTVRFAKIEPTIYTDDQGGLKMQVKSSAAFLLQSFEQIKKIKSLRFQWKADGSPRVKNQEQEREKAGDDAPLRIGLLVSGPAPTIPFFASAWIKAVRDHMKHPSDKMIYVAVGTKNPPGATWESPYTDSIQVVVAGDQQQSDGWRQAQFQPKTPLSIVGLWIMADGDDTKSQFTTWLRQLVLETL